MPHRLASLSWVFFLTVLAFQRPAEAAPQFYGIKEALPAPRAAVLHWDRSPSGGNIVYRIYRQDAGARPIGEIQGQDYVVLGLEPGIEYHFLVRAADATGEEQNQRTLSVVPLAEEPDEEWRAVWVQRFEWTGGTETQMRDRLDRMMRTLGEANFNAVVFQVRGQGDTLYPSQIEPWSTLIPAHARSWDPVRNAMEKARRNGLEFHAWINLMVIWQGYPDSKPGDLSHPFYLWANPTDPSRQLGVIHDAPGKPSFGGESKYTWLTPGNPNIETYLRRVVLDFVERYQPEGLHWDDRTALPQGASHDPVSLERFRGRGNPAGMRSLEEWQMDQLSRILSNIYVAATAAKPDLLVTESPFGIYDKARIPGYGRFSDAVHNFGSDPERWLQMGILDALIPQIYWNEGDPEPNYGTLVRDWKQHNKTGRPIWPGSAIADKGGPQPVVPVQQSYVALTRALGMNGNTIYHYGAADESDWRSAGRAFYTQAASVPRPPHKAAPRTGQVILVVTDAAGMPVTDAWVTIGDRSYTYLSSADGFVGIPVVPPGRHAIRVEGPAGGTATVEAEVAAGQTSFAPVQLP